MEDQKINDYLSYKLQKKLALDEVKRLDETYNDLRVEVETYLVKENIKDYKTEKAGSLRVISFKKYDVNSIINELIKANILPKELIEKLEQTKIYPNDFIESYADLDEATGEINTIEKKEKTLNFVINSLKRGYNENYNTSKDYIDDLLEKFSIKSIQVRTTF